MSVSLWSEETSEVLRGPGVCRKRVVEGLLQLEEKYLPSPLYITLIQRDPDTREALAKWTLEVCREHRCAESVFLLAVSLLDRYLSTSLSLPVSPTCLTAACILIASKLIDNKAVSPGYLSKAANSNFLPGHLLDMESIVLATLTWDVATVTASDFLPHFLSALSENEDGQRTGHTEGFLSSVRSLSDTLVALCVCDAHLLGTPPSLVAAAALSSACRALGNKAPEMDTITTLLAGLCQTEKVVVQYYSELIDSISTERLRSREKQVWDLDGDEQDEEVKDERAGTPTDLREIQF